MLKEVEEHLPKGKSGQKQPHIRLINFQTLEDIYCSQKENAYKREGLKEFLLCGDCETKLSIGEKYVRGILYGTKPNKEHTRPAKTRIWHKYRNGMTFTEGIEIRWVEFSKFKQFQLGIIWKMCIANGGAFKAVTARATIIEKMRQSILRDDYDESFIPCAMERLHDPSGAIMEFVSMPKSNGCIVGLVMGGYIWNYFIEGFIDSAIALQKHGKLMVKIVDVKNFSTNY